MFNPTILVILYLTLYFARNKRMKQRIFNQQKRTEDEHFITRWWKKFRTFKWSA